MRSASLHSTEYFMSSLSFCKSLLLLHVHNSHELWRAQYVDLVRLVAIRREHWLYTYCTLRVYIHLLNLYRRRAASAAAPAYAAAAGPLAGAAAGGGAAAAGAAAAAHGGRGVGRDARRAQRAAAPDARAQAARGRGGPVVAGPLLGARGARPVRRRRGLLAHRAAAGRARPLPARRPPPMQTLIAHCPLPSGFCSSLQCSRWSLRSPSRASWVTSVTASSSSVSVDRVARLSQVLAHCIQFLGIARTVPSRQPQSAISLRAFLARSDSRFSVSQCTACFVNLNLFYQPNTVVLVIKCLLTCWHFSCLILVSYFSDYHLYTPWPALSKFLF